MIDKHMKVGLCVVGIVLILVGALVYASNQPRDPETFKDYVVINQSSKASPAGVFANAVKRSLNAGWYQSSDCTDAARKFKETPNALMVWNSSVAFAAANKGLEGCQLSDFGSVKPVMVSKTYMSICHLPNKEVPFKQGATLGMASMYAVPKHEAQWGGTVKLIPYSGSKTVLQSLRAGNIDWGWMGQGLALKNSEFIVCPYTTNPVGFEDQKWIGHEVPGLTIGNFTINIVVMSNNMLDTHKLRNNLYRDKEFVKYIETSAMWPNWNPLPSNIDKIQSYVKTMVKTWK
jgi:hypothetical protein